MANRMTDADGIMGMTPEKIEQATTLVRRDNGEWRAKVTHVGWLLCKDGSFWRADDPAHAGACPDCTPLYSIEGYG